MSVRLMSFTALFVGGMSGALAFATVPYGQLETLRRQSVAVRVLLDFPDDSTVKTCGLSADSFAELGGKLQASLDGAAEGWKGLTIQSADLEKLKSKIALCKFRGSCHVYEKFLSSAQSEESIKPQLTDLQSGLNTLLEKLEAKSYKQALKSVPEPCNILDRLRK